MLRGNQQRTGYISENARFSGDSFFVAWSLLVERSEEALLYTGPVAADFNGDGKKDVLVGILPSRWPVAEVFNGPTGTILWRADCRSGPMFGSPAIMEVTDDNSPEVFLHTVNAGFRCLNGTNGATVWSNSSVGYGQYSAPLVIGGAPGAVIVGDDNGIIWSLDATTGGVNWSYPVGTYVQPPSLGDVDDDDTSEIIIGAGTKIYVFELAEGVPKWVIDIGDSVTTPALANMDNDRALEIVIYNYTVGTVRGYNYEEATPFMDVLIGRWTPQYGPDSVIGRSWPCSPGLADITGDGIIDVVIHNGVTLYCIDGATRGIEWSNEEMRLFGSPVMADLDDDGALEIVCTGKPQPHFSSWHRLKVVMFEHTGRRKWRYAFPYAGFPDPSLNEACLVDVNDDGDLEIVVNDYSCWVAVLSCCRITGVEERISHSENVVVLPPIFKDKIELMLKNPKLVEYTMYNVCGRIVLKGYKTSVEGRVTINMSEVRTGIYFLKIKTEDEIRTFKVIKIL